VDAVKARSGRLILSGRPESVKVHEHAGLEISRFGQEESSMAMPKVCLTAAACLALGMLPPTSEPDFTDWSTPENLGSVVNSSFTDAGGSVSKDGLSLYFHSNRSGNNDIYVSQRGNRNEPWGPPVNLGTAVNSTVSDAEATLSRDEHWLFFNSTRDGGVGSLDIWVSYRAHTHDDFDWQPAVNVGGGVNSIAVDTGAAYFENDEGGAPQLLFSSNRQGGLGQFDLYSSELLPEGTFGPAVLITELSSAFSEPGLSIRFDGLEVFFFSGRLPSQGGLDLWTATRKSVLDPWSAPTNLGSIVNTIAGDQQPHIAPDRETLYFTSNREGGFGGMDLYVTTRSKQKH
jgi:hypothetical protein